MTFFFGVNSAALIPSVWSVVSAMVDEYGLYLQKEMNYIMVRHFVVHGLRFVRICHMSHVTAAIGHKRSQPTHWPGRELVREARWLKCSSSRDYSR